MIKAKINYKNAYNNLNCRICKNEEQTQTHVLERYPGIHPSDYTKSLKDQLFGEDIDDHIEQ